MRCKTHGGSCAFQFPQCDVATDEAELLDAIGDRMNAQTEMLGKMLERLTEIRVILQGLADR